MRSLVYIQAVPLIGHDLEQERLLLGPTTLLSTEQTHKAPQEHSRTVARISRDEGLDKARIILR